MGFNGGEAAAWLEPHQPHLAVEAHWAKQSHARLRENGVSLSNMIDRGDRLLLACCLAKTLALDYAAVEIWQPDEAGESSPTNVVATAWKSADTAPGRGARRRSASCRPARRLRRAMDSFPNGSG